MSTIIKKPKTQAVSRKKITNTKRISPKKPVLKISHFFQTSKSPSAPETDQIPSSNIIQENKRKATEELGDPRIAKLLKSDKPDANKELRVRRTTQENGVNPDLIESLVIDSKKIHQDESRQGNILQDDKESLNEFCEFFEDDWNTNINIDLNSFQRCEIKEIRRERGKMILNVTNVDSETDGIVECSGFWMHEKIKEGEVAMIQAKRETDHWIIDNDHGFLVSKPDFLISATTIASSLFCQRKTILGEKFRKIDLLPSSEQDQSTMVVGKIVHQLLQQCLQMEIHELHDIFKAADDILNSSSIVKILYECNTTMDKFKGQVYQYVNKIFEFIQHYIKGEIQTSIKDLRNNFEGKIESVKDIEENFWLPQMGIKGKIDVTVEVNINSKHKLVPLEVKTGRPSLSLEHKGQLILYTMMMNLIGYETDVGLLLYLKDNVMQEITGTHRERRDIIIMRNNLAHYLAKTRYKERSKLDTFVELPEPIHHPTACSKCPYNTLCSVYLSNDENTKLSPNHPMTKLTNEIICNLKPSHIDYVLKWISLLDIEETSHEDDTANILWIKTPEEREKRGSCISNLKIVEDVKLQNQRYQHIFTRSNDKSKPMDELELSENDYVMLSTKTRINIASGFVIYVKSNSIAISMDKDVTKRFNENHVFHIDKYPSSSLFSFSFANVGGLLNHNEICNKLRRIIIDREPATFSEKLPRSILSICSEIIRGLNGSQQRAILKCLSANEYILIKGMPGTGKTQTLVALIQILNKMGTSVLITAHTHSAVDNILLRLIACKVDFLRLGSVTNIHPELKEYSEETLSLGCDSPESLDKAYKNKNIVAVTCFGAYHVLLQKRMFDVCIVDESTQVLQPAILRPLYSAKKFILVGDPEQLQPLAKSFVARKLGATQSLFSRLDNDNNTVILKLQYRMNMKIMSLANKLTYKNQLETDNQSIANATIVNYNPREFDLCEEWIKITLSCSLDNAVMILNTGSTRDLNIQKDSTLEMTKNSNIWETAIVLHLLKALVMMGVDTKTIGIITPFRDQVMLMKSSSTMDIEINTVDQYQGRDKDVIIFSCSKNLKSYKEQTKGNEILEDHERLTVAITRAKLKLIIIGDKDTLMCYSPFKKLFESLKSNDILNLVEGSHGFSWKKTIDILGYTVA